MYQDVTVVKRREGMAKHGWFGKKGTSIMTFSIISSGYVVLIFVL